MKIQLIQIVFCLCCSPGLMADKKWSMTVPGVVDQNFGEDAIIPCSFTTPYTDYQGNLTAIWRTKLQVIYRCVSKGNLSESEQNCTESTGRYSLLGDPRRHNISLRIKNILFMDAGKYICRVELDKQVGAYETSTGTILKIRAVPQTLDSIYIQTLPSGEQFVTCDVKGTPPPTVTWIVPENMNASLASVQSSLSRASSSIPANLPNTNYTCQIHGKNGTQDLSIYFSRVQEQQQQIPFSLFLFVTILSGVFFVLFVVTLAVLYKKGSSESVDSSTQMNIGKTKSTENDEDIYVNV